MKTKFRFHVLGVPHTKTNLNYTQCAYTQKIYKFCKMMTERGHEVIHYGVEGSNPICTENVIVVSDEIYKKVYGNYDYKNSFFKYNVNDECYQTFYKNAIIEINKRKKPHDFLLPFWGAGVRPVCDVFPDLIVVEPGIGYGEGLWAKYKIFESYAIYHAYRTLNSVAYCHQNQYEVVIPNYFDLNDFEINFDKESRLNNKDRYFLFVGRVYDGKGVNIAIQVCQVLGIKLKIAGQLSDKYKNYKWPDNIEYVGSVNTKQRSDLMKNAIASFLPSQYVEPFGGVQIENLLCGTPTITSDWGGFAENNINGLTGYRCRTFDDYLNAALNCLDGKIDYKECRKFGENFSLENVALKYEKYFNDVLTLYTNRDGWYAITDETRKRINQIKN